MVSYISLQRMDRNSLRVIRLVRWTAVVPLGHVALGLCSMFASIVCTLGCFLRYMLVTITPKRYPDRFLDHCIPSDFKVKAYRGTLYCTISLNKMYIYIQFSIT